MKIEDALHYTQNCFHGELASCSYACPLHLDIRSFLEKINRGSWTAAYRILRGALIFPEIVCRLCDAPCQEHCLRKFYDSPPALPELEMACLTYVKNKTAETYNIPPKSPHIEIIGAGVSGLACAFRLAVKKYRVTVYERGDGYGGILREHESARLFLEDIARQLAAERVDFCFNSEIKSLDQLAGDAVYIATGSGNDQFSLLGTWNGKLLGTAKPGVFLGGSLTGANIPEAIEQGARASKQIEIFLKTGKNTFGEDDFPLAKQERYVPAPDVQTRKRITMADPDAGYTAEEARAEAGRCLKCNCAACLNDCEMLSAFRKKPRQIATEIYTDTIVVPELSGRSVSRQIFSCNLCGHCSRQCPEQVDMGALFLFARRDRAAAKNAPPAFHAFWLKEMEQTGSLYSIAMPPRGRDSCGYAFFPGCQLGASNPDYVKQSFSRLNTCLNGDVGLLLNCCGAPAYWAGEVGLHERTICDLRAQWLRMGKPVMIFACTTCQSLWREYLPEAESVSLYELLVSYGVSAPSAGLPELAVFDPCSASDNSAARDSVRQLARSSGAEPRDLPYHNENAKCCGWGGHIQIANGELFDAIVENRIGGSDLPYLVYCANCRDVFAAKGKQCLHILDLLFGLDDGNRPPPSLKERESNRLMLKQDLLAEWWGISYDPPQKPWDRIKLAVPPLLRNKMDRRLVSENDVQKTIWEAEKTNERFFDPESQTYIGSLIEGALTLWVQYAPIGPNKYRILDIYYHRMRVQG